MFEKSRSHILPFERDRLFVSIYDACRHRALAISEATALTNTVIGKLQSSPQPGGIITRNMLVTIVNETLGQFDTAAHTSYAAFHPVRTV